MGQCLQSLVGDEIPTFVGIKFTSPKLDEGAQAFRVNNNKYAVFLGNDQLITAATALGMDSFITTTSNLFPEITLEALNEGKLGNVLRSREKQESLAKMMSTVSKYGKWVETMKAAMSLLTNINPGPPRAPLKPITTQSMASMAKDLQNLGLQVKNV